MRIRFLILTLALMFMFTGSTLASERYYWVTSDNQEGFFFDTETLKFSKNDAGKINPDITDAWLKISYTPDGAHRAIDLIKALGYPTTKLRTLNHVLQHVQINTATNQIRIYEQMFYDKSGNVLLELKPTSAEWMNITPDSRYADIRKTLETYTFTYYDIVYNRGK